HGTPGSGRAWPRVGRPAAIGDSAAQGGRRAASSQARTAPDPRESPAPASTGAREIPLADRSRCSGIRSRVAAVAAGGTRGRAATADVPDPDRGAPTGIPSRRAAGPRGTTGGGASALLQKSPRRDRLISRTLSHPDPLPDE